MLYVIVAVLAERRALMAERAVRRIGEATLLREFRALTAAAAADEAVLAAADEVLDGALAQHYQHHKEGDPDA